MSTPNYARSQALTASEARRTLFSLLEAVNEDEDLAVHITSKHGTGVLIGERHWNSIVETLYLFTDPVNSIRLSQSIVEFRNGGWGVEIDLATLDVSDPALRSAESSAIAARGREILGLADPSMPDADAPDDHQPST